jgi:hypothetical protein
MTDSEKDREPRDADPYDRPRGVRFSREESEWLEALADSMYSGQKGARRSFAAAIREALSWGMSVTRGEAGPRLRELAKALGLPLSEAIHRVVMAGLERVERETKEGGAG